MKLEDFLFPFGELSEENEWIQLANIIPWDLIEEKYAATFEKNGAPGKNARIAVGALIIKQRIGCSDRDLVNAVKENPYYQFFLGQKEYTYSCPFGASTLVDFRKRVTEEMLAEINEMVIQKQNQSQKDENDNEPPQNKGTLILDATCTPADITFPQDVNLLNDAREKTEKIIDELHKQSEGKKPRTYRNRARKEFLAFSKSKRRTRKTTRKAIRKQLQYIRRNLGHIAKFISEGSPITKKQSEQLAIIELLYKQQQEMYDEKKHSVTNRIVSIAQPFVRPIVRGKAKAKTEFGAKLHISVTNGFTRVERISFEAFNEGEDLIEAVERHKEREGAYPERLLADRLYRNRKNLQFCKEKRIKLTGPALGRPKKDLKADRKQEYIDICERNAVEGKFGEGKKKYGLDRIAARLEQTSIIVIGLAVLVMNLNKRLRNLLRLILSFNIFTLDILKLDNC